MTTKQKDAANELAKIAAPMIGCSVVQARHWIRTKSCPHNRHLAAAWTKALAAAKTKVGAGC